MAKLHIQYREDAINPRIVELTRRFIQNRPWRGGRERKLRMFDTWLHGACIVYGIPHIKLVVAPKPVPRQVGKYVEATDTDLAVVVLNRFSVISLFHQFRHHMQAHSVADQVYKNDEQQATDAQAWACSLFYIVDTKRYRRAVRKGRVSGVQPADLLKDRAA